jgi:hypothetical protein
MNTYAIFLSEKQEHEAVKLGFSWPGFFFTWIWAICKRMPLRGIVILVLALILGGFAGSVGSNHSTFLALIFVLPIRIFVALKGNEWRRNSLRERGYTYVSDIKAKEPEEAIELFAKSHQSSVDK